MGWFYDNVLCVWYMAKKCHYVSSKKKQEKNSCTRSSDQYKWSTYAWVARIDGETSTSDGSYTMVYCVVIV